MVQLAIIFKDCLQNVFHVIRVRSKIIIPESANESVSILLAKMISNVMVQPVEVDEMIENGAAN